MNAEEKVYEYIDAIAANLGVAAEHVYAALVKQAVVSGIGSVVWAVGAAIVAVAVVWGLVRITKSVVIDEDMVAVYFIGAVILTISGAVFVVNAQDAFTAFYNPEYWAMKEILSSLKAE